MLRVSAYIPRHSPLALCFLWFLLTFSIPAQAQAPRLRIATLELGTCGHLEHGRPIGFCYELADLLARAAGMEPVNHLVPLARGLDEIASGAADAIIMSPEGNIADLAEDIGRVKSMTIVAWARVETPLRDVRDLGGKTVAVIRGSRYEMDQARALKFIPFPSKNHELGFKMLMAGRVDAVLGPLQGLTAEAGRMGLRRRFLGEPLVLECEDMRVYVSRRLPEEVRDRLKAALNRLIQDGSVTRMRDKYPL